MPTVEQILRDSGLSDEQIRALEPQTISAFSGVLSRAEQERQQAELERRSYADFYENKIVPSLTAWDEERARTDAEMARSRAEAAFYRTQAEEARKVGFIPSDAPGFQPRDNGGRYVANAPGGTPGSPTFFDVNKIYERAGDAVGVLADIQYEHQRLFNQPMPISPSELVRQADAVKLDPKTFAARTFNWDARRKEINEKAQKDHDDKIRNDAIAENDRRWSEKVGSNPDVRFPQSSRFSEASRAVRAGERPDPLMLSDQQRRSATSQAIRAELVEEATR